MLPPCVPDQPLSATRQPVHAPHDALAVFLQASLGEQAETIVLVLDHRHRGSVCLVVSSALSPDALVTLLVALGRADRQVGALVVASTARVSTSPSAQDELTWFEARERLDDLGVDLLDWFLIVGGQAGSMAELTDSQCRWRSCQRP